VVPRAHWKGFLKLSLVSCPIALYPAVAASERISFRQVNKQTGNRLRQRLVDAITGETVQSHNKGRGYVISLMDVLKRSLAAERPIERVSAAKPAPRRMAVPSKGSHSKRSNARARKTG
jgi:DNA end-binding protein Ku